ncbi:hypothetical protein ACUSIJ_09275 [Pseudochelatococcus sp. B33]
MSIALGYCSAPPGVDATVPSSSSTASQTDSGTDPQSGRTVSVHREPERGSLPALRRQRQERSGTRPAGAPMETSLFRALMEVRVAPPDVQQQLSVEDLGSLVAKYDLSRDEANIVASVLHGRNEKIRRRTRRDEEVVRLRKIVAECLAHESGPSAAPGAGMAAPASAFISGGRGAAEVAWAWFRHYIRLPQT